MGNKSTCNLVGRGTISFQRESNSNIKIIDVLHLLGMFMNLALVSTIADKGYNILFQRREGVFKTQGLEEGKANWG